MLRKTLAGFVLGLAVSLSMTSAAETLNLTGTVDPPALAVTFSPSTVDLSGKAGTPITKSITIANMGEIPAAVSLASPTDVTFTGLKPLGANVPGFPPRNLDDPSQADRSLLSFSWNAGSSNGKFEMHDDGTAVRAMDGFANPYSGQLFTLQPNASANATIDFQASRYLAAPVNITGSITFTIAVAQ